MIGCVDDDGINLLVHLVQHLTKVVVFPGFWESGKGIAGTLLVHIAQCDDVFPFAREVVKVGASPSADPDDGDVEFLVG